MAIAVAVALTGALLGLGTPADAHGTGTVLICEPNSGAQCQAAAFAVCDPGVGTCNSVLNPSKGPRDVVIRVSNFPSNSAVHLWWLKEDPTNPAANDCTQLGHRVSDDRTALTTVTTDGNGTAEYRTTLPPGTFGQNWLYGSHWVCGTTVNAGGSGTVGDRLFTVYPA